MESALGMVQNGGREVTARGRGVDTGAVAQKLAQK
jgi:hypothetical protein